MRPLSLNLLTSSATLLLLCALTVPAIRVVNEGRVRFVPGEPHTRVYLDWLERIRPWCMSRPDVVSANS